MVINPSIERVTCPWCLDSHYGMDDHTPYIHEIFQYPIYQWIGLRDNFSRNAPYFSWENRWFPVYIFPTKPMICSIHHIPMIYPWYIPSLFSSHYCEITGEIGIWPGGGGHHRCQLGTWAVKNKIRPRYKVGPQTIAKLVQITPITMVYGPYNYSYTMLYYSYWGL